MFVELGRQSNSTVTYIVIVYCTITTVDFVQYINLQKSDPHAKASVAGGNVASNSHVTVSYRVERDAGQSHFGLL